jgi:hypothetical protein
MSIRTRLLLLALLVTLLAASFVSRRFVQERDRDIAVVASRFETEFFRLNRYLDSFPSSKPEPVS